MAKRKAAGKGQKKTRTLTVEGKAAQIANQVTWLLSGHLKNAQISYIRVCVLLARVRDENLYSALKHPDMEDYAEKRLHLGRASLYRYLQVHDWIAGCHKEWLQPKPKGFIPDLSDVADLIWIENELVRKNLAAPKRADLENLKKKALEGTLRDGDLSQWRQKGQGKAITLKSFMSKIRSLRKRCSGIANLPPEVVSHLDAAIAILRNEQVAARCGLDALGLESTYA
jgi:hypothetical protein